MTDDSDRLDGRTNDHPSPRAERSGPNTWDIPLLEYDWTTVEEVVGEVQWCVSWRRWPDGTMDFLVSPDPYPADGGMPTAYAHRQGGDGVPLLSVHGPGNLVVNVVTRVWDAP